MNKRNLLIAAAAAGAVGAVLYARSSAGAKSTNSFVTWLRGYVAPKPAVTAAAKTEAESAPAVRASDTPDE